MERPEGRGDTEGHRRVLTRASRRLRRVCSQVPFGHGFWMLGLMQAIRAICRISLGAGVSRVHGDCESHAHMDQRHTVCPTFWDSRTPPMKMRSMPV